MLVESSVQRNLKGNKALIAPLPNLFKSTFEQAYQQSPGEQWLKQRLAVFDTGKKQKRKEVLEEFLQYMQQSSVTSMQELFSHQAHLFFIRLTSWFAVTLPMFYELALQVKVFLAFLEFREQSFIRAFFESGVVTTLMHTLSVNFDCSDEVRCLVLAAFHKLAANGRYHKELLCAEGLIPKVMDCMSDGMQWETLKYAGRLLCELFRANPKYQHEVIESLQSLLTHKFSLAQRVGMQALISLLAGERHEIPAFLGNSHRHKQLVKLALPLLDSSDMRVGADAYCLICRVVLTFSCDDLLFDFCQSQIAKGDDVEQWLRLELDSHLELTEREPQLREASNQETPFGGWWKLSTERLYKHISIALAQKQGTEGADPAELAKLVKRSNAVFCDAFRKESGQILQWGLLLFVLKRCPQLCHKLVDDGLTETLLMCLLDVARPVQQGAALSELHRLRLMSPLADEIVASVLVKKEAIQATSLVEFMAVAKPADLERARFRLRNVWNSLHCIARCHEAKYCADEVALRQKLLEKDMAEVGIGPSAKGFFITGVNNATEDAQVTDNAAVTSHSADNNFASASDDVIHRAGIGKFDVRRVPVLKPIGGNMGDEHSRIEMGLVEDIPFCGSLSSLIFDPLDISADEESPLIQELRTIEGFGTFRHRSGGAALLRNMDSSCLSSRQSRVSGGFLPRESASRKASHRPTLAHSRALALRHVPPRGIEYTRPKPAPRLERSQSTVSGETDISLYCGSIRDFGDAGELAARSLQSIHEASHMDDMDKGFHDASMAETSAGPEWMQEASLDLPSSGPSMEFLAGGPSLFSDDADTFDLQLSQEDSCGHCCLGGIKEGHGAFVSQRTGLVALLEVPRFLSLEDTDETPKIQKRILQVAQTPHHVCMAFDPLENEQERQHLSTQVTALLHPKTRRLIDDINGAGKFPRKKVSRLGKVPPLNLLRDFSYPSGSVSARANPTEMGWEAGSPQAERQLDNRELGNFPRSARLAPISNSPVITAALGSMWHALDDEHLLLQDAGDRLKSFFPASARSAAQ